MELSKRFQNTEKYKEETEVSPGDLMITVLDVAKAREDIMRRELLKTLLDSIEYGQAYAIQLTKQDTVTPFGGRNIKISLEMAKLEETDHE